MDGTSCGTSVKASIGLSPVSARDVDFVDMDSGNVRGIHNQTEAIPQVEWKRVRNRESRKQESVDGGG